MVDPIEHDPSRTPEMGESAGLPGRPAISLGAFKAVAVEVAEKLGEPVAICRRPETDAGAKIVPFANKLLCVARDDGSEILDVVYPPADDRRRERPASTALHSRVVEILTETPGGEKLDTYFGISSDSPAQPADEAARSEELIRRLSAASHGLGGDIESVLRELSQDTRSSGADPEALRALIRSSKTGEGGRAG